VSRIGKNPVDIPKGVEVKVEGQKVTVKGPKGTLSREIPGTLNAAVDAGKVVIAPRDKNADVKALWGLNRVLVDNMVKGVANGFKKTLEITGVGYKAELTGKNLKLTVGLSHTVTIPALAGITFSTESPTKLTVEGPDKELVGRIASEIRNVRPPEPYKGKGIRYSDEHIRRKAGKATVK
jgi:large subunit ribosomal protein L6